MINLLGTAFHFKCLYCAELLKCLNGNFVVIRESLVNKELLVLVVTVGLLDLWDPLDLLDLLERPEERSELHKNNNSL